MTEPQLCHRVLFCPYPPGEPAFLLSLYDLNERTSHLYALGYRLDQVVSPAQDWTEKDYEDPEIEETIFAGKDFGIPSSTVRNTPETVQAIMQFLTVRPGRVDPAHFEGFTDTQNEFVRLHAKALSDEAEARYLALVVPQPTPNPQPEKEG